MSIFSGASVAQCQPRRDVLPDESEDPRNALLASFDQFVDALIANGLEAQLRLKIEARFPPLKPEADLFEERQAAIGTRQAEAGDAENPAGEIGLTALIADLKRLQKLKMSALAHEAVTRIKAKAEADLAALRGVRNAGGNRSEENPIADCRLPVASPPIWPNPHRESA